MKWAYSKPEIKLLCRKLELYFYNVRDLNYFDEKEGITMPFCGPEIQRLFFFDRLSNQSVTRRLAFLEGFGAYVAQSRLEIGPFNTIGPLGIWDEDTFKETLKNNGGKVYESNE